MTPLDSTSIESWHAHVYFGAESRDAAWAFRELVGSTFADRVVIGRFHERPVGPHLRWSFQIELAPRQFGDVIGWLSLNHGALDVFVHPNTGDALRDHRDCAMWIGSSHTLNLRALDD